MITFLTQFPLREIDCRAGGKGCLSGEMLVMEALIRVDERLPWPK